MKLCALLLFLLIASANGTTYYVDPVSGNNASAGTSTATAWAQMPGTVGATGAGWVQFVNGDVIYVKGGFTNYSKWLFETAQISGSETWDSIRIISGDRASPSWGTGAAIIDGGSSNTFGIMIGDNTHISGLTVDGFEIRNIAAGGLGGTYGSSGSCCIAMGGNGYADYIKVRNCWLHDAARTVDNTGHGISAGGETNLIYELNRFGPGIGTKGVDIYLCNYGVIRSNTFIGGGDHCIAVNGTHFDIQNNVAFLIQSNAVHGPIYGIKIEQGYCDVWNNVVYRLPGTETASEEPCGIGVFVGGNNRIVHNTVYGFRSPINGREQGVGIALGCESNASSNNVVSFNISRFCLNEDGGISFFMFYTCSNNVIASNDFFYTSGDAQEVVCMTDVPDNHQQWTAAAFNSVVTNNCTISGNVQLDPAWSGTLGSSRVRFSLLLISCFWGNAQGGQFSLLHTTDSVDDSARRFDAHASNHRR